MNKKNAILLMFVFIVSCAPLDVETPYLPVTQISFYASDTPAPFIVPVTETPQIVFPVTETPFGEQSIFATDTPIPFPAPRWWEVYFTAPGSINNPANPTGSVEEKLISFINAAQTSVHIAGFEFNLTRVAEALIAAKGRGVDVKWMADDKNGTQYDTEPGRGQFALMAAAGIEVRDDARSALMHNKFWVFDQQTVWTGSTNATVNGIYKQNNNVLVIHSPEVAFIYEREFQEMWNNQFGPRAPSTINTQWAILDTTPLQVLFTPEDNAMSKVVAVVNDAQFRIRFLAFSFTHDALAQVMIEKARAGVDVGGVFETFGSNNPSSKLGRLWCAGLSVRQDGNSSFLHHKAIIVDDSIVITGSMNFSSNADETNEENVIILDNPEIAALYLQEYERNWSVAQSVPMGAFTCE
ncbi:MAG: phospholipase D-like domain-containing protein [Anaerolineales bacterium]